MNESNLELTCKEIKRFYYLIQWQIVEIGQCYTVACSFIFCSLQSICLGKSFLLRNLCWSEENCLLFHLNTFCTCLTHIQRILVTRFHLHWVSSKTALPNFKIFVLLKWNKRFCTTGICYKEVRLVAVRQGMRAYVPLSRMKVKM